MSLAEKIVLKPHRQARVEKNTDTPEANGNSEMEKRGFRIMSDVVWEELGRAIMDEIGSIVFAAGNPKEFRLVCFYYRSQIGGLSIVHPAL